MKKHIPTVLAVIAVLAICIIAVVAVTLGEDGTLRTLVRTDTDAGAWQDNAGKAMDSEKAAELALEKAGVSADGANVTAWKEAKNGDILWQVEIADVDAGSGLTVTYFVTLNALTGEVTMLDMTRFFQRRINTSAYTDIAGARYRNIGGNYGVSLPASVLQCFCSI